MAARRSRPCAPAARKRAMTSHAHAERPASHVARSFSMGSVLWVLVHAARPVDLSAWTWHSQAASGTTWARVFRVGARRRVLGSGEICLASKGIDSKKNPWSVPGSKAVVHSRRRVACRVGCGCTWPRSARRGWSWKPDCRVEGERENHV